MIIKCYKDNILIGIKLDKDGDYLYVATMHEVQESKIVRRLHSGRIKEVITECESYCSHVCVNSNVLNSLYHSEKNLYIIWGEGKMNMRQGIFYLGRRI